MPLRGIYIPDFDQISDKISVLGSYTLIVPPMGVKFGMEEGTFSPLLRLLHAKFYPIGAMRCPCRAKKNLKSASE